MAVNDRGQVLGATQRTDGTWRLFLSHRGQVTDLGTLGGASSTVAAPGDPRSRGALNERGDVVGVSDTAAGQRHGFLWRDGRMVDLGTLGGSSATPMAVNERRQVVGSSTRADGTFQAFAWQGGA